MNKALLLKIFSAAYMQRWNDKIRPLELTELDKQTHKMIIAYVLGKLAQRNKELDWVQIIEGGIFELLQRLVVTDLKPAIFYRIQQDKTKYKRLNKWVYKELREVLLPLGEDFRQKFKDHFKSTDKTLNQKILSAAHHLATRWEFAIIEQANPHAHDLQFIKRDLERRLKRYQNLKGFRELKRNLKFQKFIDLCGQLRFQTRWANVHRVPKTSVLGHMLFVAVVSYLVSQEIKACQKRSLNNYFTGLFHDLPEVLTRDIISPVKRSIEGLGEMIKEYERELMEKEVYNLLPQKWQEDLKMFTQEEFESMVIIDGKRKRVTSDLINEKYNHDQFYPRDGELIKAVDDLSAFIEADEAIKNGSAAQILYKAKNELRDKYQKAKIAGIDFGRIYEEFK